MTVIELTQAQINKVLAENSVPVEPPVDPIEPPPIDPPPVVEPPTDPEQLNLMQTSFSAIWGAQLLASGYYPNRMITVNKIDGISISIPLARSTKNYRLKITDVENTSTSEGCYGVISWRKDFSEPFEDDLIGSTSMDMVVTPDMGGRTVYANYRIDNPAERHAPWYLTLQVITS